MEKRKIMSLAELDEVATMQTSFINKLMRFADANGIDRGYVVKGVAYAFNRIVEYGSFDNYDISTAKL